MLYTNLTPPILSVKTIRRFHFKIQTKADAECWEWNGCKDAKGYGVISAHDLATHKRRHLRAARISLLLATIHRVATRLICERARPRTM
jgi:hypothetical protein